MLTQIRTLASPMAAKRRPPRIFMGYARSRAWPFLRSGDKAGRKPFQALTARALVATIVLACAPISGAAFGQTTTGPETSTERFVHFELQGVSPGMTLREALGALGGASSVKDAHTDDCKQEIEESHIYICLGLGEQVIRFLLVPRFDQKTAPSVTIPEMLDRGGSLKDSYADILRVTMIETFSYLPGEIAPEAIFTKVIGKHGAPSLVDYSHRGQGIIYTNHASSSRSERNPEYPGKYFKFYALYPYECSDENVVTKCYSLLVNTRGSDTLGTINTRIQVTLNDGEMYKEFREQADAILLPTKRQRALDAASGVRY